MIDLAELHIYIRSKLDEVKEEFWNETDILLAVNLAVEKVWDYTMDLGEELYLQDGTITTAVGKKEIALPARARYVSAYCNPKENLDYRPWYLSSGDRLDLYKDYTIGGSTGSKFVLKENATVVDTINVRYKAIPARADKLTGSIDIPDILWIPLLEVSVLHCKAKDENIGSENASLIQDALRVARSQMSKQQGLIYNFRTG